MSKLKVQRGRVSFLFIQFSVFISFHVSIPASANDALTSAVEVRDHQLVVHGEKRPQLFGAEVQYFRLRGGYGPNVPRERVLELWNKALDRFVEARMNAISFYIPWDFHEYAEGQFDFTGSADVDRDGNPDYPSRDLVTFFRLLSERGIKNIMVRPGPYINAEWGFLGFGAIPNWFHEKYPDSHMRNPHGWRTRLYDYHDPDLARHTALWFKALYENVLNQHIGPGKPIIFIQLDNETNYQWQSIYNHNFSRRSISRYQKYLQSSYDDIGLLNRVHQRNWMRWHQVQPPLFVGRNLEEDRDWYRFADWSIYGFLHSVRDFWQKLGVIEPNVMFTLAESYNAPVNGLLPNFVFRNAPGSTGLMTVNLYPKTFETEQKPLLNFPFKADLDVKAADEANDSYFGSNQEWVMGPEIQGGWWKGIRVSPEARQQTYLTVLGHGMKALFVYYFNEGQNWGVEWAFNQIKPLYKQLLWERQIENEDPHKLSDDFWNELQARSDRTILTGLDVRRTMKLGPLHDTELHFDAPLDGDANPRDHYFHLKRMGERVVAPHQEFLARSVEAHDDVAIVKDSEAHLPVADTNLPSVQAAAEWTGGLLGYLMNSDLNPRLLHGDLSPESNFLPHKIFFHLDTGLNAPRTLEQLKMAVSRGQTVVNFLASGLTRTLGINIDGSVLVARDSLEQSRGSTPLTFYINSAGRLTSAEAPGSQAVQIWSSNPVYQYELNSSNNECEGILYSNQQVVGYRCKIDRSTVVQIGALLFEDYNSNAYSRMRSPRERDLFLKALTNEAAVSPLIEIAESNTQTVAFARMDPAKELLWITVKTGSLKAQEVSLKLGAKLLDEALRVTKEDRTQVFVIKDLLSKKTMRLQRDSLLKEGLKFRLGPNDSAVYTIRPRY